MEKEVKVGYNEFQELKRKAEYYDKTQRDTPRYYLFLTSRYPIGLGSLQRFSNPIHSNSYRLEDLRSEVSNLNSECSHMIELAARLDKIPTWVRKIFKAI